MISIKQVPAINLNKKTEKQKAQRIMHADFFFLKVLALFTP